MGAQRKSALMIVLVFFSVYFLSGCANLSSKTSNPTPTLTGSWKLKTNGDLKPSTLTFRDNGTFQLDIGADRIVDISGEYEVYDNQIRLLDAGATAKGDCFHAGFYNYKLDGHELTFEVFAEECAERKNILTAGWISIPTIPESSLKRK